MTKATMTNAIPEAEPERRTLFPRLGPNGKLAYTPTLTELGRTDTVDLVKQIVHSLPIIFVPGIMGSNLKEKGTGNKVWTYNGLISIALQQAGKNAGYRQQMLHPTRTEVDAGGDVPDIHLGVLRCQKDFLSRGWGEVGAASYQSLLLWLERHFNGQKSNGFDEQFHNLHSKLNKTLRLEQDGYAWGKEKKPFEPLTEKESAGAEAWTYPVYACGYNWLDDNEEASKRLAERIKVVIEANRGEFGRCSGVILVTHSMGGLTARRCAQLPGMEGYIAGIVHGVMPALGAPVAYRRCKVGMWDESKAAALVVGRTGKEVTAVFAQAPGALQLLPSRQYPQGWLELRLGGARLSVQPDTSDPHTNLYKERYRWWGLINEEWLAPVEGWPIKWKDFLKALQQAEKFHLAIENSYHPNSWIFYGIRRPSFAKITWNMRTGPFPRGAKLPAPGDGRAINAEFNEAMMDGLNPQYISLEPAAGRPDIRRIDGGSYLEAWLRSPLESGDGTVPAISGSAPKDYSRQMFGVPNIEHESAYSSEIARQVTAYAIAKIGANARQYDVQQGDPPLPAAWQ